MKTFNMNNQPKLSDARRTMLRLIQEMQHSIEIVCLIIID
jgi:hypothetical protein